MKLTRLILPLLLLVMLLVVGGCAAEPVSLIEGDYKGVDLLDWAHVETWYPEEGEVTAKDTLAPEHLYANITVAKGYSSQPFLDGCQLHSLNVEVSVDGKKYVFASINPNDIKLPAMLLDAEIGPLTKSSTRHFPIQLPTTEKDDEITDGAFWITQYKDKKLIANLLLLLKWGDDFYDDVEEEVNNPDFLAILELVNGKLVVSLPTLFIDGKYMEPPSEGPEPPLD